LPIFMMGAMFYFQPAPEEPAATTAHVPQTATSATPAAMTNLNDSLKTAAISQVELKNKELRLVISTLGGQISTVELNEYKAYNRSEETNDKNLLLDRKSVV